jgi:hypothetical protein
MVGAGLVVDGHEVHGILADAFECHRLAVLCRDLHADRLGVAGDVGSVEHEDEQLVRGVHRPFAGVVDDHGDVARGRRRGGLRLGRRGFRLLRGGDHDRRDTESEYGNELKA